MTEDKKLMAGLLRFIEREEGITLHEECVSDFFKKWREDIRESTEPDTHSDSIAVSYGEAKAQEAQELAYLDNIEKSFRKWDEERNPVTLMVNDLLQRGCSNTTVASYRSISNSFMRMFRYEPEFALGEFNKFMYEARESSIAVKRVYSSVLKLLWEVQGLIFPVVSRRQHQKHSIVAKKVPEFTPKEIIHIIKKVRQFGTPEEQYYFCLATIWCPRRIELAEITSQNFTWNGKTGTLTFVPHKQQGEPNARQHCIPEGLTPYLKVYSYKVKQHHPQELTRKFWSFVTHLDLPVPNLSIRRRKPLAPQYKEMREKHQRTRGYGWHAFRHSITTALIEGGFNDTVINAWIGWQSGNPRAPMVRTYYTPHELDSKIISKHPFIKFWADK